MARMVIENDIDRLTDAKVLCKMEIYETLREFDDAVSWQYTKRGRKRSERVCAGGLTAGERFKCLKVLIDEDPDRQYWQLQEMMEHTIVGLFCLYSRSLLPL